ncbi:MAG: hypothetical protein M0P95_17715 [Sulfuritalea sp.]|nr:hypothetical protein [Sulfuritalea sp.]
MARCAGYRRTWHDSRRWRDGDPSLLLARTRKETGSHHCKPVEYGLLDTDSNQESTNKDLCDDQCDAVITAMIKARTNSANGGKSFGELGTIFPFSFSTFLPRPFIRT